MDPVTGSRTSLAGRTLGLLSPLLLLAPMSCVPVGMHPPEAEQPYRLEVLARCAGGPEGAERARIWAPAPITVPGCEQVSSLVLHGRGGTVVEHGDGNGNRILYIEGPATPDAPLELGYTVDLVLQAVRPPDEDATAGPLWEGGRGGDALDPTLLEAIRKRALYESAQAPTVFGKLRALAVLFVREYRDGPPLRDLAACFEQKRGDALDLCRLYVAHARSLGIEARLEVGWAVPRPGGEDRLDELRIWTTARVPGMEWIPIDLRDLMLHPREVRERFGGLEEPRLRLSSGTDLRLVPPRGGDPLAVFAQPVVEGAAPGTKLEVRMTLHRLDG
ncbi:MAG: transglutaminase family protein [Planctomycetota bacterium]